MEGNPVWDRQSERLRPGPPRWRPAQAQGQRARRLHLQSARAPSPGIEPRLPHP